MRVALFARYSSHLQNEQSLDAQIVEMEVYAARKGWTITHRFLLPETKSADVSQAPEFQAMVTAAKHKEYDVLLLHKLDRLGRDRETSYVTKCLLRRQGIKVASVVENLDDSIFSKLVEAILDAVSEFYSLNLGSEIKKGMRQLTRTGHYRGGKVPWGLQVTRSGDHMVFSAHPVQGPIMVQVFEKVAAGERSGAVLEWVAQQSGESVWSRPTFLTRIRNPIYYGLLEFGKTSLGKGGRTSQDPENLITGRWEGLVSEEVWQAANSVVDARGANLKGLGHKRTANRPYLLTEGAATCARCGKPLVGGGGYRRYVCSGYRDKTCAGATMNADALEAEVIRLVREEVGQLDLEGILSEYEAGQEPMRQEARQQEARLRGALTDVRRRLGNLVRAISDGMDFPVMREEMASLTKQESSIAEEIATVQLRVEHDIQWSMDMLRMSLTGIAELVGHAEPDEMKGIIADLFSVEVDLVGKSGTLVVKFRAAGQEPSRPLQIRGNPLTPTISYLQARIPFVVGSHRL